MKDYYKILELEPNASQEEIKKQFRKLSKKYHPDVNPDGEEKFKEIQEAYEYLTSNKGNVIFLNTKPDIYISVEVTLEEIYNKVKKEITYKIKKDICPKCQGNGRYRVQQKTPFGILMQDVPCPNCNGTGRIGEAEIKTEKIELSFEICILMQSFSIEKKDYVLNIIWNLIPSSNGITLNRHGITSYVLKVNVLDAILGATVQVPTLSGDVKFKIPSGVQNETTFSLKGKGFNGQPQIVIIDIQIPTEITEEEKESYEKIRNIGISK